MAKSFHINGRLQVKGGDYIGAGTNVTEVTKEEATKKYGLKVKEFEALIKRGVLGEGAAPVAAAPTESQAMSASRFMEIGKVVSELSNENAAHFTEDGKPEVPALKEKGLDITDEERDEFWEVYNAE